jgi:hypothetical protein
LPEKSKPSQSDPLLVGEDESPVKEESDRHTARFFPGGAPNQVFMLDRFGFKYGTDDKGHAAAIILSVLLLALLGCLIVLGTFFDRSWIPDALQILGTAFTFVAGVAVGKSLEGR